MLTVLLSLYPASANASSLFTKINLIDNGRVINVNGTFYVGPGAYANWSKYLDNYELEGYGSGKTLVNVSRNESIKLVPIPMVSITKMYKETSGSDAIIVLSNGKAFMVYSTYSLNKYYEYAYMGDKLLSDSGEEITLSPIRLK